MAVYCTHLLCGHTLLSKSIKVGTVKRYLYAAIKLFPQHDWDPTLDSTAGVWATCITDVLREGKRWESMPNRQEPVTIAMMTYIIDQSTLTDADGPECVLSNWCVLALAAGLRLSEWFQSSSNDYMLLYKSITLNIDSSTRAFLPRTSPSLIRGDK